MHSHEEDSDEDERDTPTRILSVRDKRNQVYRLEWWAAEYGWSLWLADSRHGRIGYAHAQLREDALFLADLRIEDSGLYPRTLFQRLLRLKPKSENYRQLGLGTLLLQHLEQFAIERGYRLITGGIVEKDIKQWPNLPDWYRRRGYEVFTKPADSPDIGVLAIRKSLL